MEFNTFESIKIGLASPDMIRSWSRGEVKKPETINYRTLKPERDGLFCERIFGPTKDWECHCGKYKRVRFKGKICERCGVEITTSKVRRERMGHITLAAPVSHIWYFKGIPSRMGLILDISPRILERVLYFASYIVLDPGDTTLTYKEVLSEKEFRDTVEKYGENSFRAGMGAEAVRELLENLDLETISQELKDELEKLHNTVKPVKADGKPSRESGGSQKKMRIIKRLEVIEAFRLSSNKPEWMIMDVIPVIPPEIRPMVQIDGGRFSTSDLNDLYRRVINRNNRLKRLMELGAPDIIIKNEKRMLQEAVDSLIDNGRRGRPVTGPSNRPLKSLSDMLKGKQGRFRQNLLGKRVDYSGRSVIVVGPDLKIYQCGLPKEMALELFKPFVMKRLVDTGAAGNIKSAKRMVERSSTEIWDALEHVIKGHPVMLNRAPTLHRLGIQAFEVVLVEGRALKLHPMVCAAYNADFDGDQMAVHVPLSAEAQAEARMLMLSANNLLKPQDGKPVTVPSQDMVLGAYYLTNLREGEMGDGMIFRSINEAILAYDNKVLGLHAPIKVQVSGVVNGKHETRIIDATVGRIIFNQNIAQDLGFVDRTNPNTLLDLEVYFTTRKKELSDIVDRCIRVHGAAFTAEILDKIKAIGYKFSTRGGITVSVDDMVVPSEKGELIHAAEEKVDTITRKFKRGLLSDEGRYKEIINIWNKTTEDVTNALIKNFEVNQRYNPIYMMLDSGARGSKNQIKQLAGMRGLMVNTSGKTIEIPIKSNFREGLSVLEYFISSKGARKGLADTALRTADSGYLTRRLVDVSQDVIIKEVDCGTTEFIRVSDIRDGNEIFEKLATRISGRYAALDILHPETGEVLVKANTMISDDISKKIQLIGITEVAIRSVLTCKAKLGVCAKCYGSNLATGLPVNVGEAVGIIAAQSIGEPGTQLTMRTFHTGGVSGSDITQGLPRVEELFEGRKPKNLAILTEIPGVVSISDVKRNKQVTVKNEDTGDYREYLIPFSSKLKVKDDDVLDKGDELTVGASNPHDILRIKGSRAVQTSLIQGVQRVYKLEGVDINDKHIEVIVRQMLKKIKVIDQGDSNLLLGALIDRLDFDAECDAMRERIKAGEEHLRMPVAETVLLGITKASLATNSFLSAASFQETTKVLTDAAIKGKVDPLLGLKENVIIGKLIPAGTGIAAYNEVEVVAVDENEESASIKPVSLDSDIFADCNNPVGI